MELPGREGGRYVLYTDCALRLDLRSCMRGYVESIVWIGFFERESYNGDGHDR